MTDHVNTSVPLWQQLQAVAQALAQVRRGVSGTAALEAVPSALRPGVQALLFQTLRQLGRAQALRAQLASRTPAPLPDALLCTALALAWDPDNAPYEPHTLVNQAVEAAKQTQSLHMPANFLNACLRRFLRERDALVKATDNNVLAQWNHPEWWVMRLQKDHPDHWQDILRASNQAAPMTWRVNTARTSREVLQADWANHGLTSFPVGAQGLLLAQAHPVRDVPGFAEGRCSVQDAAAQCAAQLLLDGLITTQQPLRILDACAAPGGKTAHLLELLDDKSQVTALDIDPQRCERIAQNLQRIGRSARIIAADAALTKTWWDGQLFDAILLDAPCTASGIVRRHPDVRWLRRERDIDKLAAIQKNLLKQLWPLVKPGGRLLYCTCSVFRAEGENQVKTFVEHNTHARLLPSLGHLRPQTRATAALLTDNLLGDHDGFYYALLEKLPAP
ncbi:16S rRNA (cytosine(967)-C(5))-methyltransferase RsmB [Limnohabitans sp.]|uniref:16S rRNA (cytosine(967)-C(5))-methyltransferase RsmB n=1 Tax=Limnohabitans sp. TaxID=1907725 RepID=UPI00286EE88D|nr:16S rRNA (cytosine(967)-C(5))-methyltransferase RsmB [Limnohabitans sp.]